MPSQLSLGGSGASQFNPNAVSGLVADWDSSAIIGVNDGSACASWTNRIGSNHAIQATGAKQATYRANSQNNQPGLEFASGQCYQTSAVNLSGAQTATIAVVLSPGTTGADQVLVEMSADFNGQTDSFLLLQESTNKYILNTRNGSYSNFESTYPVTFPRILIGTIDKSLTVNEVTLYANGRAIGTRPINADLAGNLGNRVLNIGARNNAASLGFTGILYRILLWNKVLSATELAYIFNGLNNIYRIYFDLVASDFSENNYNVATANYIRTSTLARVFFNTDAAKVEVESYNDIFGTYPVLTDLGLRLAGSDVAALAPGASGQAFNNSNLSGSGQRLVEITQGLQSKPASIIGTFARSVTFGRGNSSKVAKNSNTLLLYGDSIVAGGDATNPSLEAWGQLLRGLTTRSIAFECWGYRALYDDTNTATLLSAFVTQLNGFNPTAIWLGIGTNDYGLNLWTAANFGIAYGQLLDAIHALLPNVTIYCQTPIERVSPAVETANGLGSTLANYRTQISNVVATRQGFCRLVTGTGILNSGTDYDSDGVHPNTTGHGKLATAFRAYVGI